MRKKKSEVLPCLQKDPRSLTQRQLRVGEIIRRVLAQALREQKCWEPALQDASVTVSEVRVSADLHHATAFVMPLGGAEEEGTLAALQRAAGYFRKILSQELSLRLVPLLRFRLDDSLSEAQRIRDLLNHPKVQQDLSPHTPAAQEIAKSAETT